MDLFKASSLALLVSPIICVGAVYEDVGPRRLLKNHCLSTRELW